MEFSKSRFLILALFYFLYIPNLFSDIPQGKINLAVSELSAKGVSSMDASVVSDFLREELVNTKVYRVVERSNMELILNEHKFQMSGCTSEECAVQLGQLLNVQKVITGSVSTLGKKYYISIRLIDVEKGEILLADSAETDSLEGLRPACQELANRIVNVKEIKKEEFYEKPKKEISKEIVPEKPTEVVDEVKFKSEHIDKWGIGLHYTGVSLKYFSGYFSYELKNTFSDNISAIGPRLYINFNPDSNAVIYIGGEYCSISGKTELQKFTGTSTGSFIGMEIFRSVKSSVFIDIGPYKTILKSEFAGVNITENDIVCNLGFNIYF